MKEITKSSRGSPNEVSITTSLLVMALQFVTGIFKRVGTGSSLQREISSQQNVPAGIIAGRRYPSG